MPTTPTQVLLYAPNLIGYSRVIFTVTALDLMICFPSQWILAICLYLASFVGDLFDGLVARRLKQTSTFGGLLDMVTDRCSTLGLLYVLGCTSKEPIARLVYMLLIILDISSHWCQMYSTTALTQSKHHKAAESNEGRNFLVRAYYEHYYFFGYLCVGAEFTYIALYILQNIENDFVRSFLWICLPGCLMKQIINVFQLTSACYAVAEYDAKSK